MRNRPNGSSPGVPPAGRPRDRENRIASPSRDQTGSKTNWISALGGKSGMTSVPSSRIT